MSFFFFKQFVFGSNESSVHTSYLLFFDADSFA